ncbi:hypothetical protein ES319_D11G174600v1 [Gossypium barbadense]|uniref:Uncharacterized protein n=1 Tax=Gossypium barbadense TaxID=3634 RepID=A0A5J5PD64_GOSBA|nr:hypothetical protein ES319_D11G174600v1 [Gossypium barbadense]
MCWFFLIIILSSSIAIDLSEGSHAHHHHHRKKSAVVVGRVYCDTTCSQEEFSRTSHFISGASVAVECKEGTSRPGFVQEVKTNEHGEFELRLPFSVSRRVKKINGCSVKFIKNSEPDCNVVASIPASSALRLVSGKHGTRVFSAGAFSFKPLKQPNLCRTKPKEANGEKAVLGHPESFFFPPPLFPPNPFQPPPLLPPILPPPAPLIPNPFQPPPAPLIPNPFQPPPAPLIPNPFQPPPAPPAPLIPNPFQPPPAPPAPFIPNPFQPPPAPPAPPAPWFHLPPIPGLTPPPSPPPPPPPTFPFPLPPFHFPPVPPFPGIPPASASTSPKKSSP